MERFLLNVPRSLNELRVLLLESHRHSRDMEKDLNREVHKAEWKVKEQKLQDDIKSLREKLLLLVRTRLAVYTSSYFTCLLFSDSRWRQPSFRREPII